MSKKKKGTIKTVASISVMIVFFKILSFFRQTVTAYYFGATTQTDSYYVAYGFIMGIISGAVSALTISTIAVYTKIRIIEGINEASRLINSLIEISFPVLLGIVLVIIIFAPGIAKILAPGYDEEQLAVVSNYIRVLAPSLLILSVQFTMSSVLDSNKSFFAPRMETFAYNIAAIIACLFFSKAYGIKSLLIAQLIAAFSFSLFLIFSASKYHRLFLTGVKNVRGLKEAVITMLPLLISNSVVQINEMVDKAITSSLGNGATSSLYYSQTLHQFVIGVLITSVTNVMITDFSEMVAKNQISDIRERLSKANNFLICVLLAISVVVVFGAKDIVKIVYFRGSFSEEAVELTSRSLIGYSLGFGIIAVNAMLSTTLYAFRKTKKTLISCVVSIMVNCLLSIVLSRFWGIIGVTIGTCISSAVGLLINYLFLRKHINDYPIKYHIITLLKCLPFAGLLSIFCWLIEKYFLGPSIFKFVIFIVGILFYLFALKIVRVSEIEGIMRNLTNSIRNRN